MNIPKGSRQLLLKFGYLKDVDCIKEHKQVIDSKGYVWFGKIGSKPQNTVIDKMLESELQSNFIILKSAKECYVCHFDKYTLTPPKQDFPEYYITKLRMREDTFSIWFRITEMRVVSSIVNLEGIVVESSQNPIISACRQSMASHFFTLANKEIEIV